MMAAPTTIQNDWHHANVASDLIKVCRVDQGAGSGSIGTCQHVNSYIAYLLRREIAIPGKSGATRSLPAHE